MTLRYVEKFTNITGTISYEFPLRMYEWETSQPLRTAIGQAIGADYGHDHHGYAPAPFSPSRERIRVTAVTSTAALLEAALDEARAECYRIGLGYLYRLDSDGSTRRRALARLDSMPGFTRQVGQSVHIPLIFDFLRVGPWESTTATTGSQTCNSDPETFTINNPGNLPCMAMVFRLRSNAVNGCDTPTIVNETNDYTMSSTRVLTTATSELRINTETAAVELTTDDGSNYANDFALFTIGAGQGGTLFRLEPGDNTISVDVAASANFDFEWSFYPRWV